jgi:hypothetical protein
MLSSLPPAISPTTMTLRSEAFWAARGLAGNCDRFQSQAISYRDHHCDIDAVSRRSAGQLERDPDHQQDWPATPGGGLHGRRRGVRVRPRPQLVGPRPNMTSSLGGHTVLATDGTSLLTNKSWVSQVKVGVNYKFIPGAVVAKY